jgi:hypothetical protein
VFLNYIGFIIVSCSNFQQATQTEKHFSSLVLFTTYYVPGNYVFVFVFNLLVKQVDKNDVVQEETALIQVFCKKEKKNSFIIEGPENEDMISLSKIPIFVNI